MHRVHHRPARLLVSLSLAGATLAMPAAVSADPPVRFAEHAVNLFCNAQDPTVGALSLFAGVSSEFGASASIEAWLPPDLFVGPPDLTGFTDGVQVTEGGGGATLGATIPLADAAGVSRGDVVIDAILTPIDVEVLEPFREGNRWIKTTGTIAHQAVSGTFVTTDETLPDFMLEELGCAGEILDISVFETQPHAFVLNNEGIVLSCSWETEGVFSHLFAVNDVFGTFAEAALVSEGVVDLFGFTETLTLTSTSLEATIPLTDFITGDPATAVVSATLSPLGSPVTSDFRGQNNRQRVTEQRLIPSGTIEFSTGEVRTLDATCFVSEFDSHFMANVPAGPKAGGKAPANDTADGATPIRMGRAVNDQTRGAAVDPEIQVEACPEPDDRFGHTVWYSFIGTGGNVTIDTAGSDFDTIVAVYDESLTLIDCNDDVEFEPIGGTLQAALTIPTDEGATYYVQAGGFVAFDTGLPEFGRLRLSITPS